MDRRRELIFAQLGLDCLDPATGLNLLEHVILEEHALSVPGALDLAAHTTASLTSKSSQ
jgi:hypothetical protein